MTLLSRIPKIAVLSTAALAAAMVAQAAGAAPISSWNYTVQSSFSDWDATSGIGGIETDGSGLNSNPTKLGWSSALSSSQQSSIEIIGDGSGDGQVTGVIDTGGPFESGATFTHTNNVLGSQYATLDSFTLDSRLFLSSIPDGTTTSDLMISFDGMFAETPNQTPCAVSSSPTPCNDIFVLTNQTAEYGLNADGELVLQQTFNTGGWEYAAILLIDGLSYLGEDVCAAAGADGNCIGLTTIENQVNNFETRLRILSEPLTFDVPGPGSLALLVTGFGLIGLGFATRRGRRSQKQA